LVCYSYEGIPDVSIHARIKWVVNEDLNVERDNVLGKEASMRWGKIQALDA
jgi:hypothetical protein